MLPERVPDLSICVYKRDSDSPSRPVFIDTVTGILQVDRGLLITVTNSQRDPAIANNSFER